VSKERHINAHLAGHNGPHFVLTDELLGAIDGLGEERTSSTIRMAARSIPGYVGLDQEPETDDGYIWWWSPRFRLPEGDPDDQVVILLPWSGDKDYRDGTYADRSCAIYTKGRVEEDQITQLMRRLIDGITSRQAHDYDVGRQPGRMSG
jgi:hypothetical protein